MFNVNVKTENANDGCFAGSFASLDKVRTFIKSRAAMFRVSDTSKAVTATIVRNGDTLASAKIVAA